MSRILITGCSSGIGLATALELARAGHKVYAAMRNPSRSPQLAEQALSEKLPLTVLTLDVDSDDSVEHCFASLYKTGEQLDVLVNNAGIERHGTIEELSMADFRATMETNYFGALRCIRQVVTHMREARSGCIVNVTSVAGRLVSSPLGGYAASKFALEAVTEALAQEMKTFGVRVALIEPGIVDTAMAHAIAIEKPSKYQQGINLANRFREALANPIAPSVTAAVIRDVIESGTWKLRHPTGADAVPLLSRRSAMTDEEWIDYVSRGSISSSTLA